MKAAVLKAVLVLVVVAPVFAQDVCSFLEGHQADPRTSELKALNAERILGSVCGYPSKIAKQYGWPAVCKKGEMPVSKLYGMGIPRDDGALTELLDGGLDVRVSTVDIDNDGMDEIRLSVTGGSLHCNASYFYKRNVSGKYHLMEGLGYGQFVEAGSICGGGGLSFIRFHRKVFVLEAYSAENIIGFALGSVWRGSRTGLKEICDFRKPADE